MIDKRFGFKITCSFRSDTCGILTIVEGECDKEQMGDVVRILQAATPTVKLNLAYEVLLCKIVISFFFVESYKTGSFVWC